MTVRNINEFLTRDHDQLDALLEGFQEWKAKDVAKAKELLAQFVSALHCPLQREETILFPCSSKRPAKRVSPEPYFGSTRKSGNGWRPE